MARYGFVHGDPHGQCPKRPPILPESLPQRAVSGLVADRTLEA